jgi:hypothetical protein
VAEVSLRRILQKGIILVHTLVFFELSASAIYLLVSTMINRRTRWTTVAALSLAVESAILVAFGWSCPLRIWAERLGAESGSVTDIYLPKWLAERIFIIFTPIMVAGYLGLAIRRYQDFRSGPKPLSDARPLS